MTPCRSKLNNSFYAKKGQAAMAVGSIVTLIVGVGVATLVLIFVGALGGQTYNLVEPDLEGISGSAANQFTPINGSISTLSEPPISAGTLTIVNASDGGAVGLGNFSIDYHLAELTLIDTEWNNSLLNASYVFGSPEIENSVKGSIISGFGALETTGDYMPIIVLAVVISLVLTLVLSFTAFGGGGKGEFQNSAL